MGRRRIAGGLWLAVAFVPQGLAAQDASLGCKVLLCAAATAPGWAGIPYCVPVMQELAVSLRRGRPWPVCAEALAPREAGPTGEPSAASSIAPAPVQP